MVLLKDREAALDSDDYFGQWTSFLATNESSLPAKLRCWHEGDTSHDPSNVHSQSHKNVNISVGSHGDDDGTYSLACSGAQRTHAAAGPPAHPPSASLQTSRGPAGAAARTGRPC